MTDGRPRDESELVELLHAVDVPAPERLHARVQAMTAQRRGPVRARRRLALGAAVALAVAAAVLAAVLPGGGSGLSVGRAATAALGPATLPAPLERSGGTSLEASVQGVSFPYWEERFGWRSVGAREDSVDGRRVETVFYESGDGRHVGYAIAGGSPPNLSGGRLRWRDGVAYRFSQLAGANVVAWVRAGHLCVIAGRGVSDARLLALASWEEHPQSS
jgi:hypothetical protein